MARRIVRGVWERNETDPTVLAEMRERLPSIPYPGGRGKITKWRKEAIAAGYPRCEECTMPIARSHWPLSITICQVCEGILGGWFEYKTVEDDNERDFH